MEVGGREVENEVAKALDEDIVSLELWSVAETGLTYTWEAVPVEYDGVEKLSKRQRLQHPATEPPRPVPLAAVPGAPDEALCLGKVPPVLESAEQRVDGDGDTQLLRWVDAQGQTGERGAHGRGVGRCECRRRPGVSYPERLDLRVEKM